MAEKTERNTSVGFPGQERGRMRVRERGVVVKPGGVPVPMFEFRGNNVITRELVTEKGEECDSGGKPFSELYAEKPKKPRRKNKKGGA